ncbi:MAG: 2-hydroxyacyl-CoA dehydratase [Deltaproteobacteria bacterium]|nr:2-hydroxyacyl-CoA dehydratase [Deltaproteobacteria bacterium]
MNPFETMKKHYHERSLAAKAWKENGGKVVGYISDAVPVEMIIAAGLFPLRLSGDPLASTDKGDETMEFFFEPSVRSIYDQLLTGALDFLDLLVIPHYNDSVFKLYYYLMEIQRMDPSLKLPDFYLFDMLYTKWFATNLYNRQMIHEFKKKLEDVSGKEITPGALSNAIDIVNENRSLLKKISGFRKLDPPLISGTEALQIIGSSMFMDKKEHNRLLMNFLVGAEHNSPKKGVRVSVEGSQIDHLRFYELVESYGAVIVTESHSWGDGISDHPVDNSFEPLGAITDRYHLYSSSPRLYPKREELQHCLATAKELNVRGTLFYFMEWDDMPAWEYPEQKKILDDNHIPSICFRMQKYHLTETEEVKSKLKAFIEAVS